jgi:hypothetical protein
MGNLGFISSKSNLTIEQIYADIQDIINRRFDNKIEVELSQDYEDKSFITVSDPHSKLFFNMWLQTNRKIEHSHGQGFMWWIELIIDNELAVKYKGKLSDEGTGFKTWQPDIHKYPTYQDYFDTTWKNLKIKNSAFYQEMLQDEKAYTPEWIWNLK